jgi:tellurium resistance protein TerD
MEWKNLMTINLAKGENVDLTKQAGGSLTKLRIGLGWDARTTDGSPFDLDASVVALDASGFCFGKEWFVYFNQLRSPGDVIVHQGDELTGDTAGDDEQIVADLAALPGDVDKLVVAVTIHKAAERAQNFGMVSNAYCRVLDENTGTELARFDLSEDAGGKNVLVFGEAYRKDGGWKFKALGDGFSTEMQGLIDTYKIS